MDGKQTILVVEDEPLIAHQIAENMSKAGWRVMYATDVKTSLLLVESIAFDFATLSIRMSETENSLPVAEALEKLGIPYAFLTSYCEPEARKIVGPSAHILFKTEMGEKLVPHVQQHIK